MRIGKVLLLERLVLGPRVRFTVGGVGPSTQLQRRNWIIRFANLHSMDSLTEIRSWIFILDVSGPFS